MANTKVYVNTDSSGGTNGSTNASGVAFPSLTSALTYVASNKIAGDIWTVICSAPSGVADTVSGANIDINGISTNSTGYLHIRPNRGNEGGTVADQRHGGIWSTSKYRIAYTNGFTVSDDYVYITGLQLFPQGNSGGSLPPQGPFLVNNNCKLERCFIRADPAYAGSGASGANIGIKGNGSTPATVVANNVVVGFVTDSYVDGLGISMISGKYYNNTVVGCWRGAAWGGVFTGKNNLITGSDPGEDFVSGVWNYSTMTNNASEDATAPGTANRTLQTFTFSNAAGLDYRLSASDTGAKGFGTDLSAENWTDVDGNTNGPGVDITDTVRSTWSIGASEAVSAGGSNLIHLLAGRFGGKLAGRI